MVISKSDYLLFLRHPAWLWIKKYDKSKLSEPDSSLQARFDEGTLFEYYAEKLFLNAVKLGYKTDGEFDGSKYRSLPQLTKEEIAKGTKVIFQGRLEADNLTLIFDVLERVGENTFDLYEIKSSTSAKPEHIPDLAFQTIVLEKSGLKIRNLYVLHVNNEYVRKGEVDPKQLTAVKKDVTEKVRGIIDETLANIDEAFKVLSKREMPDISPRYLKSGSMEEWLEVFKGIKGDLPEYSIYNLCSLSAKKAGELEDLGIEVMNDIPDDFELSVRQLEQVTAVKNGRIVNKVEIKKFLDTFEYPLHFFDYETFSGVIPAFDGLSPYQQVPFQYSLHIQDAPGGEVRHKEYLHTENSDPTLALVKQMSEDFEGSGTILVWHESFEKNRNEELGEMHPEYKTFLENINERILDLKIPFSTGLFVDKDFFGSASLKDVAPVLVLKPSYDDLEVSNGITAQNLWMETILGGENIDTRDEIIEDLRKYCTLDTFVLIKILEVLNGIIK